MGADLSPKKISITATGGTGSSTSIMTGHLIGVGVLSPAGATYDITFADADGFGVCGAAGLSGNVLAEFDHLLFGSTTLTISNATNGVYTIKLMYKINNEFF